MSDIQVCFEEKTIRCPYGTPAQTLLGGFGIAEDTIAALRINNEIRPVQTMLTVNATLKPVLLDSPEGAMIYRRSLAFLLAIAARNILPDRSLQIGHSLGNSYYYTFDEGKPPPEEQINALQREMESLVRENLPITVKRLAYEEALEVFNGNTRPNMAMLLHQRCASQITVNECGGYLDMYVEPLVPRSGLLSVF
jgi:uridine kinase